MAQRNQRDPDDEITVGFKTAQRYAAWVHQAAKRQGISASKYLERVVLRSAGADLGVSKDEIAAALDPVKPAREIIEEAARAQGITPREFVKRAAAQAAAAVVTQSNASKKTTRRRAV